ncbi:MAG: class I SAM-dependent methyltransferase [Cyclobacteriaceae bacterium]|nr:class I SAM-dependent methyltransferase [Flammeovirgaceae bacterium]MCO5272574.1 class I SAM-dependent methyltransferase [Cyclobacteriaceae bacterium]
MKIKEFVYGNKRINRCLELLFNHIPDRGEIDICEIGCSIGLTTYQIALEYPLTRIHGYDIAEEQIKYANQTFNSEQVNFFVHDFMSPISDKYDLITLFDVFEHIPIDDRKVFATNIGTALKKHGKIIMTVPSHFSTIYNKASRKDLLQIVDEEVKLIDLIDFANDTSTNLSYYSLVSIWSKHDYAHVIFDREKPLSDFDSNVTINNGLFQKIKIKLGIGSFRTGLRKRKQLIKERTGMEI